MPIYHWLRRGRAACFAIVSIGWVAVTLVATADEAGRPAAPDLPPHGVVMNAVLCVADDLRPMPRVAPPARSHADAPQAAVAPALFRRVTTARRQAEEVFEGTIVERCRPLAWTASAAGIDYALPPLAPMASRLHASYVEIQPPQVERTPVAGRRHRDVPVRCRENPVWPLVLGTDALAGALARCSPWSQDSDRLAHATRVACDQFELCRTADGQPGLWCLTQGRLRLWRAERALRPGEGDAEPPGRWRQADKLKWASKELFRALPGGKTWWFVTSSQTLWTAPMQGKVDREVTKARELGKERLATLIDRDLARSFIFGDGWYLDLGDEAKLVKEPKARWPRPAKDAPDIERLRVYRSWVDRK
jgi:hypothetical protein